MPTFRISAIVYTPFAVAKNPVAVVEDGLCVLVYFVRAYNPIDRFPCLIIAIRFVLVHFASNGGVCVLLTSLRCKDIDLLGTRL